MHATIGVQGLNGKDARKVQAKNYDYDAGNFGMQRRRVHGVMSDPAFNPRAMMDDEPIEYTKAMEIMDTIPGPLDLPEAAPAR